VRMVCYDGGDAAEFAVVGCYLRVEVKGYGVVFVLLKDGDAGVIAGGFDCEGKEGSTAGIS
jgi:hypothetical protein